MKKVSLMVIGAAAALGMMFSSCSKDEVAPTINSLTVGSTAIQKDGDSATVAGGSAEITWSVTKGDNDFKSLVIRQGAATDKITIKSADSIATGKVTVTGLTAGEYALVVTDKDDLKSTRTFKVKASTVAATFVTYSAKLVYAPLGDKSQACAFASSTGDTYKQADAATNAAKVDILYFYGSDAVKASFCSPADPLTTAYPDVASWSVKNATTFAKSGKAFDAIVADADLASAYTTGTPATNGTGTEKAARIYNLAKGDVVAFKTAAGKYGVLKVVDIITAKGGAGTGDNITIDVKVQK